MHQDDVSDPIWCFQLVDGSKNVNYTRVTFGQMPTWDQEIEASGGQKRLFDYG